MKLIILPLVFFFAYTLDTSKGLQRNYVVDEENENRIPYFLVEREDGTYAIEDLTAPAVQLTVSETDITYYFCTRLKRNGTIVNNLDDLPEEVFSPDKEVLFIIHGWTNDYSSHVNTYIKAAALDSFDLNVVIVDWSPFSKKNYISARNSVPQVGKLVADFILSLTSTYNLPMTKVSIVGHSLGAHVSGVAGTALEGKVNTIVALDPASPLVSVSDKEYCIDSSDAVYVQVIHTNGALLGLMTSVGHSDYYPNGGKKQPGCGLDITGSCSHGRSYNYYAESIRKSNFLAQECASYSDFTSGVCTGEFTYMGGYSIDKGISGDFYLDTNEIYPYAIS